ncbi:MAG: hypothetical protein WD061_02505 [Candidatus Saccharimonadales bacterium]
MTNQEAPTFDTEPWQGMVIEEIYPPDGIREDIRNRVRDFMTKGDEEGSYDGMVASKIAERVARYAYEETGQAVFGSDNVTLEISRMLGSQIRMAPNRHLFFIPEWKQL